MLCDVFGSSTRCKQTIKFQHPLRNCKGSCANSSMDYGSSSGSASASAAPWYVMTHLVSSKPWAQIPLEAYLPSFEPALGKRPF